MSLEGDGLRSLEMSVAGHNCVCVFIAFFFKSFYKIFNKNKSFVALFTQIKTHVKSNLVVAASACVQTLACRANALRESLLDEGVDIFCVGVNQKLAC